MMLKVIGTGPAANNAICSERTGNVCLEDPKIFGGWMRKRFRYAEVLGKDLFRRMASQSDRQKSSSPKNYHRQNEEEFATIQSVVSALDRNEGFRLQSTKVTFAHIILERGRPASSIAVMRALPFSMMPHSCFVPMQLPTPPAFKPHVHAGISVETGNSRVVVWPPQPLVF